MITVKVNTLWQGMVGVPDKYVGEALNKGKPLCILHDEAQMVISGIDLSRQRKCISERKFRDRFGGPDYLLYYYDWKPTMVQETLL